jgi:4-alpha-glucanotransferase
VAEDLGVITEAVDRLRAELRLPGMAVLQFAFDPDDPEGPHRIEHHGRMRVAYTGTHDNDTLAGWHAGLGPRERAAVAAVTGGDADVVGALTRWWMGSPAPLVMLQAQDLLRLGSEARMNTPGRASGNWRWELPAGALTARHAAELRQMTEEAGRCS